MIVFMGSNCAVKKQAQWLEKHHELLERAANGNLSNEKKLDVLATSFTTMMHQSLNFTNPKKGVLFAKTYSEQNKTNIDKILGSLSTWKEDMGVLDLIALGVKMAKKPYIKEFIDLYPRFERKFKTYATIISLSGKVKKGLMGLGGKKLKDLGF